MITSVLSSFPAALAACRPTENCPVVRNAPFSVAPFAVKPGGTFVNERFGAGVPVAVNVYENATLVDVVAVKTLVIFGASLIVITRSLVVGAR